MGDDDISRSAMTAAKGYWSTLSLYKVYKAETVSLERLPLLVLYFPLAAIFVLVIEDAC